MNAEGIPIGGAHAVANRDPLFRVDLSKCPLKCENYKKKIDFDSLSFPVSERANSEIVTMPHRLFLGNENDMESIYKAILKIKDNIEELRSYAKSGEI